MHRNRFGVNDEELGQSDVDNDLGNQTAGILYEVPLPDTEELSFDEEDMVTASPSIDLVKEIMKRLMKTQKQMKALTQNVENLLNGNSSEVQAVGANVDNDIESTISLLRQYDELHFFLWGRMARVLHQEHQHCADVYTDTLNLHDRVPFETLTHTVHHNTAFCDYMGEVTNATIDHEVNFSNNGNNDSLKQTLVDHFKILEKSQILATYSALLVVEGSRESFLDPLSMYDLCKVIVEEKSRRKRLLALSLSFSMLEQDDQSIGEALSHQLHYLLLQRVRHLVHRIFGYPEKHKLGVPRENRGSPFRHNSAVIQSNSNSPISSRNASPEILNGNAGTTTTTTTTTTGTATTTTKGASLLSPSIVQLQNGGSPLHSPNHQGELFAQKQIRRGSPISGNTESEKPLIQRTKNMREDHENEVSERSKKTRRLEKSGQDPDYNESFENWQPRKGDKVGRGPAWSFGNQAETCDVGEILGITTKEEVLVRWLKNVDSASESDAEFRLFRYKYKKPHEEVVLWDRFLNMQTMKPEDIDFKMEEFMLNCAIIGAVCQQNEAVLPALQFQAIESMIHILDSVDLADAVNKVTKAEKVVEERERKLLGREEEDGAVDEDTLEIHLRWDSSLHLAKERHRQVREIVARVGWVLNALLSHKRLAFLFLELDGLKQIMKLINSNLEVSTTYGCCIVLFQLTRSTVFENLLRNHEKYFEPIMNFILYQWKNAVSLDVQCTAGGFLFQALSFPCVISFFDIQQGPQTTMDIIEKLLNNSEERFDVVNPGLTLAALKCFYVYLVSHLMLYTRVVFRKHRVLSSLVTNSSQEKSLPRDPRTIEWILSFLFSTSASVPDVTIKDVHSLLSRERLVVFRYLIENNFHQLLLRCAHFYFTQNRWELLAASLNVLCVLSVPPFVRPLIIDAQNPESGIVHLIMIVSELPTAFRNGNTSRESHLIPCVATALQILLHLTEPPIDTNDEASVSAFNQVCSLIRANDGVRTLLEVLKIRKDAVMSAKLQFFPLVARALQLMETLRRYADTRLLFNALGVSSVVRELLTQYDVVQKEYISAMVPRYASSDVHAAGRFMENAKRFLVDETNQATLTVSVDPVELERRQGIIAHSHISYSKESLLELISRYLEAEGLQNTASVLRQDAHLSSDSLSLPQSMHINTDISTVSTIGAPTLDGIIRSYLRQQHEKCTNPISTLPQFDLRKSHVYHPLTTPVDQTKNAFNRRLVQKMGTDFSLRMKTNENHLTYRYPGHLFDIAGGDDGMQGDAVAFCDNGDTLIVGTSEGAIALFDTFPDDSTSEKLLEQHLVFDNDGIAGVFVSGDGEMFAVVSTDHKVVVMRRDTLPVVKYSVEGGRAARFSDSNTFLLTTCDEQHTCRLYDIAAQQEVRHFSDPSWVEENLDNIATFDAFSQLILSDAVLWDVRCSDKPIYRFDRFTESFCNAFHPSNLLVLIDEKVWDLRTMSMLQTVPGLKKTNSFHINPFGQVIYSFREASGITNSTSPVLSVVESYTFETVFSTEVRPPFRAFAIDPSDRYCAAIIDQETEAVVRVFSTSSGPLPGRQTFPFPQGIGGNESEADLGENQDDEEDELDHDSFWSSSDEDETDDDDDDDDSTYELDDEESDLNYANSESNTESDEANRAGEDGVSTVMEDGTDEDEESWGGTEETEEGRHEDSMSST